jgi:hypothetical protein
LPVDDGDQRVVAQVTQLDLAHLHIRENCKIKLSFSYMFLVPNFIVRR